MELTEQVARRLRSHEIQGRTVHLKVRYSNFDTYTRASTVQHNAEHKPRPRPD